MSKSLVSKSIDDDTSPNITREKRFSTLVKKPTFY